MSGIRGRQNKAEENEGADFSSLVLRHKKRIFRNDCRRGTMPSILCRISPRNTQKYRIFEENLGGANNSLIRSAEGKSIRSIGPARSHPNQPLLPLSLIPIYSISLTLSAITHSRPTLRISLFLSSPLSSLHSRTYYFLPTSFSICALSLLPFSESLFSLSSISSPFTLAPTPSSLTLFS